MLAAWSKLTSVRKNLLVRNTGWMIVGQGGNFFLQAGYFLLVARLLGVTEYGVFAGAFALVNSVTVYSSLGSSMIFMRYVNEDRASAQVYWGNILAICAGSSLLLMPVLALAGKKLFGPGYAELILVLVVANCFMSQITTSASAVFQTFERLKATAWLRAISNLLRLLAIAVLVLTLHHASAFQCSLGILASSTLAAGAAFLMVRQSIGKMRVSARLIYRRFWEGIGFSFAASTQSIYNDVDKMMLSHYGMNAANGIYTMAYRVVDFATTPVSAIDAAVLPRFFTLSKDGLASVGRMARRTVPIATLAGFAAAGFTLLASPIVVRLAGHGFADAMLAIRWLCWLPVFRGIHQLAGGALTATGRQNYRTAAQLLVAVLNFALNLIWIPSHGWLGAAWASLASDGALSLLNLCLVLFIFSRVSQHQRSVITVEQPK